MNILNNLKTGAARVGDAVKATGAWTMRRPVNLVLHAKRPVNLAIWALGAGAVILSAMRGGARTSIAGEVAIPDPNRMYAAHNAQLAAMPTPLGEMAAAQNMVAAMPQQPVSYVNASEAQHAHMLSEAELAQAMEAQAANANRA